MFVEEFFGFFEGGAGSDCGEIVLGHNRVDFDGVVFEEPEVAVGEYADEFS